MVATICSSCHQMNFYSYSNKHRLCQRANIAFPFNFTIILFNNIATFFMKKEIMKKLVQVFWRLLVYHRFHKSSAPTDIESPMVYIFRHISFWMMEKRSSNDCYNCPDHFSTHLFTEWRWMNDGNSSLDKYTGKSRLKTTKFVTECKIPMLTQHIFFSDMICKYWVQTRIKF